MEAADDYIRGIDLATVNRRNAREATRSISGRDPTASTTAGMSDTVLARLCELPGVRVRASFVKVHRFLMSTEQPDRTEQPARIGEIPLLLFIRGITLLLVVTAVIVSSHRYVG